MINDSVFALELEHTLHISNVLGVEAAYVDSLQIMAV